MHSNQRNGARVGALAPSTALLFAVLLNSSCVSSQKYDETQLAAKHFQKEGIDSQRQIADLEAENARLRRQVEAGDIHVREAGAEIDQRIASLKDKIAELGANPGDVTKFRVDGGYVYQVKEAILFALGSSEISGEGQKMLLDTVAPDINSKPHGKIFVRGHTDNIPVKKPDTLAKFPHGNLQLSASRAVEVAALLVDKGKVDGDRVVVMGFGPSEPIAPNSSSENRQKNRRVEIFVSDETETSKEQAKNAKTGAELTDDKK